MWGCFLSRSLSLSLFAINNVKLLPYCCYTLYYILSLSFALSCHCSPHRGCSFSRPALVLVGSLLISVVVVGSGGQLESPSATKRMTSRASTMPDVDQFMVDVSSTYSKLFSRWNRASSPTARESCLTC